MKIFYFFFLKKARYNWYNSNYCCIPTFNRSFLYLRAWYNKGTIGTNVSKSKQYQRFKGYRVRILENIFLFYKSRSIQSV